MKREDQIKFCEKCINRKMDFNQGLICCLSNKKAAFENSCDDYIIDDKISKKYFNDDYGLNSNEISEKISKELFDKLKYEQSIKLGIVLGILTGIVSAIILSKIAISIEHKMGFMSVLTGIGVGIVMRFYGKGIERKFGFWGAGISVFSCFLGDFLIIIGIISKQEQLSYIESLFAFNYKQFPTIMFELFNFMDIIFYLIAFVCGYITSFRLITEKKLNELEKKNINN